MEFLNWLNPRILCPVKVRSNAAVLVRDRGQRGMSRGPDVTSNREHDDIYLFLWERLRK